MDSMNGLIRFLASAPAFPSRTAPVARRGWKVFFL